MFEQGGYRALEAQGSRGDHVFAFARTHGDRQVVIAVPRLVATLTAEADVPPLGERVWNDTRIDLSGLAGARGYRDVITERCVPVRTDGAPALRAADVFERFPIAMLVSEPL
jgi:(1->4)-alpha-D-glucan 1-alpha-D-glucosylmutase